jgi:phosphopantetheinyl transferase (holo-ACP synthase)
MRDGTPAVVRVGSYSARRTDIVRLLDRHGPAALVPHAVPDTEDAEQGDEENGERAAVEWALRQATLRALAVPPRLGARWRDIEIRDPLQDTRTLLLRGELADFAETALRGDAHLFVAAHGERITAWTVLTRNPAAAFPAPAHAARHEPGEPGRAGETGPTDEHPTPDETEVPE